MSGDPPSEPPADGEGESGEERQEEPDASPDETADPDDGEPGTTDQETLDADDPAEAEDADSAAKGGQDDGEGTPRYVKLPAERVADADDSEADADAAEDAGGEHETAVEDEAEEEQGEGEKGKGEKGEQGDEEAEKESDDEDREESEDEDGEEGEDEDKGASDTTVEMHDDTTPIERKTGPASDTEQPLADHIEEMIKRLAVVVVIAGAVSLLAFPFGEDFIIFLWYSVLPGDISQPHVYHPLEMVMTQLKAASLLGLVLALPVFVYETYAFMRPGLYPHERRYYLAAVPTSLVLAFVGLLFGYFLVLPAVMTYFLYYSRDVVDIAFALGQTFDLMLILLGYLAIVFQIPLFIMLAIMMGLTTRTWLEDRRLIFWGAFLGISFLFSPDPTGMAPILVAATMVGLFEGTLMLLRWTGR